MFVRIKCDTHWLGRPLCSIKGAFWMTGRWLGLISWLLACEAALTHWRKYYFPWGRARISNEWSWRGVDDVFCHRHTKTRCRTDSLSSAPSLHLSSVTPLLFRSSFVTKLKRILRQVFEIIETFHLGLELGLVRVALNSLLFLPAEALSNRGTCGLLSEAQASPNGRIIRRNVISLRRPETSRSRK